MSLRFGILGLLHEKTMTGYDIYHYFCEFINPMWFAQQSQVYRDLGQLEKDGFVNSCIEEQVGKPNKRLYSITPGGVLALANWIESFDFTESMRYRDSFALRIFFAGRMPHLSTALIDQLMQYVHENQELLKQLDTKAKELASGFEEVAVTGDSSVEKRLLYFKISLMRGKAQYEMNINWANDVLALLK